MKTRNFSRSTLKISVADFIRNYTFVMEEVRIQMFDPKNMKLPEIYFGKVKDINEELESELEKLEISGAYPRQELNKLYMQITCVNIEYSRLMKGD